MFLRGSLGLALSCLVLLGCGGRTELLVGARASDAGTSSDAIGDGSEASDAPSDQDAASDAPVDVLLPGCFGAGPTTLASGQTEPVAIAVDRTHVYWATSGNDCAHGAIHSVPKAGGTVVTLASNQPDPRAIAVDGSRVYFYDGCASGKLRSVSKQGGAIRDYPIQVDPNEDARVLAVDSRSIYFNSYGVLSIPKAGGPQAVVDDRDFVYALAADDSGVFWVGPVGGGPSYGVFAALPGVPSRQILSLNDVGESMAMDASSIFFESSGGIESVSKNGGPAHTVVQPAAAWKLAVDDQFVYWSEGVVSETYSIRKAPKAGGVATELISGAGSYVDLAVDARCVYFANMYGGQIGRAPK